MEVANKYGNCNSAMEKKHKRKKNRSAKQIERARQYRERKMYSQNVCNNVMYDLTYQTTCHTPNEIERYRYTDLMNSQLQLSGLYIPGVTESHSPAYFLCNRSVMSPYETLAVSNLATVHQEKTSKPRGMAQEYEIASGKMSANIGTIVNEPVSKLRATAKEFIPAFTQKVEPTLELNKDKITAEEKVNIINEDKTRNEADITTDCKDSTISASSNNESHELKLIKFAAEEGATMIIQDKKTNEGEIKIEHKDNKISESSKTHEGSIKEENGASVTIGRNNTNVEHIAGDDKPRIISEVSNTQAERIIAKDEDNYIPESNKAHEEYVTHEGRNKIIIETNKILCKHITDKDPFFETTAAHIAYEGIDNIVIEDNVTLKGSTKADDENNVISKSNDTYEDDTCIIAGAENNTIYEHYETIVIESINTKKDSTRTKDEDTKIVSKTKKIQEDDTCIIHVVGEKSTINEHEETMIIESYSTNKDTTTSDDEDNTISNNNNTQEDDTPIIDQDEDQTIFDIQHEEIITVERNNTLGDESIEEDFVVSENIRADVDESGMLGILGLFANSSLHCLSKTTAKYVRKPNEKQDFGYEYFTLSNLLK